MSAHLCHLLIVELVAQIAVETGAVFACVGLPERIQILRRSILDDLHDILAATKTDYGRAQAIVIGKLAAFGDLQSNGTLTIIEMSENAILIIFVPNQALALSLSESSDIFISAFFVIRKYALIKGDDLISR